MENVEVIKKFLEVGSGLSCGLSCGCGSGLGDGLKELNGEIVWMVDDVPTLIDKVRGNYANGRIIKSDLATTSCYIAKVGEHFAHGETLKNAYADALAKSLEDMPIEQRIEKFVAEFPTLRTEAKCEDFYKWHHILTGSCEMGRNQFIKEHNLDMGKDYAVAYFLDITEDAYGGEVIKQLKDIYNESKN